MGHSCRNRRQFGSASGSRIGTVQQHRMLGTICLGRVRALLPALYTSESKTKHLNLYGIKPFLLHHLWHTSNSVIKGCFTLYYLSGQLYPYALGLLCFICRQAGIKPKLYREYHGFALRGTIGHKAPSYTLCSEPTRVVLMSLFSSGCPVLNP
jgi:hypothetical protein